MTQTESRPQTRRGLPVWRIGVLGGLVGMLCCVGPTVLAYVLWSFALERLTASNASSFLYLLPAFAIAIAWAWLDEVPSLALDLHYLITAYGVQDLQAEVSVIEGIDVRVATPAMLHRMKKDTMRPIDRADAHALREKFGLRDS